MPKNHPYINIGGTTVLAKEDILGVFDLDTASTKTDTKRYLAGLEQAKSLSMMQATCRRPLWCFRPGSAKKPI